MSADIQGDRAVARAIRAAIASAAARMIVHSLQRLRARGFIRWRRRTIAKEGAAGHRFGTTGLYVEPVATLAYARTNLDRVRLGDVRIDFGTFEGFRGKAGARIGGRFDLGGGATAVAYAQGNYVREFAGEGAARFNLAFVDADIRNPRLPDYGEGTIGVTIGNAGGVSGFVEGFGMAGRGYRSGGGRAGLRIAL